MNQNDLHVVPNPNDQKQPRRENHIQFPSSKQLGFIFHQLSSKLVPLGPFFSRCSSSALLCLLGVSLLK